MGTLTDYGAELLGGSRQPDAGGLDYGSAILGSTLNVSTKPAQQPSGNVFTRAWEAIKGKQDPRYADVPEIAALPQSFDTTARTAAAKFAGADDAAYGDIIARSLGDRLVSREKDENGFEILTYKEADGTLRSGYVNKPGLGMEDVSRGLFGAIPYVLGGAMLGGAMKGAPQVFQVPAQMGVAGSTSVIGDIGNMVLGSEQGIDSKKAALAAGAAGLFQALPSKAIAPVIGAAGGAAVADDGNQIGGAAIGGLAGMGATALARRFLGMSPGAYVQNGRLTPQGERAAAEAGVNPAEVNDEFARVFADAYAKTRNASLSAAEANASAGPGGIRLTKGMREKDYQQMVLEDQMRAGLKGPQAKSVMDDFDRLQAGDIESAVRGNPANLAGVAPRLSQNWQGRTTQDLGDSIRGGAQAARNEARSVEKEAWDKVPGARAPDEALALLPQEISAGIKSLGIPINENTPVALRMVDYLRQYRSGKSPSAGDDFIPDFSGQTVDQVRRVIGKMTSGAQDPTDKAAAGAVYDAYNRWISRAADEGHFAPEVAGALRAARDISREVKGLFEPRDGGRLTPAARRMADVIQKADTPEGVVSTLFGKAGPRAEMPKDTVATLTSLKTALARYAPVTGRDTWNDVRLAYWQRITTDGAGNLLSPGALAKSIAEARQHHGSAWSVLFSKAETNMIADLQKGLQAASYRPSNFRTNSSGSAYAGATMFKELLQTVWKALAASPVVSATAGVVARPIAAGWYAGKARAATGGVKEVMPSLGGYGGGLGSIGGSLEQAR